MKSFECYVCYLKKDISQCIYNKEIIQICIECSNEKDMSETCIICDKPISFVQMEYLINEHSCFNSCIKCLSIKKDDEKIKNNYIDYLNLYYNDDEDLDFFIEEAEGKDEDFEEKYYMLESKVDIFLKHINCKTLEDAIILFCNYKENLIKNNEMVKSMDKFIKNSIDLINENKKLKKQNFSYYIKDVITYGFNTDDLYNIVKINNNKKSLDNENKKINFNIPLQSQIQPQNSKQRIYNSNNNGFVKINVDYDKIKKIMLGNDSEPKKVDYSYINNIVKSHLHENIIYGIIDNVKKNILKKEKDDDNENCKKCNDFNLKNNDFLNKGSQNHEIKKNKIIINNVNTKKYKKFMILAFILKNKDKIKNILKPKKQKKNN